MIGAIIIRRAVSAKPCSQITIITRHCKYKQCSKTIVRLLHTCTCPLGNHLCICTREL